MKRLSISTKKPSFNPESMWRDIVTNVNWFRHCYLNDTKTRDLKKTLFANVSKTGNDREW